MPAVQNLGDLIAGLGGASEVPPDFGCLQVSGLTLDSREVQAGYLFFARPGLRTDGTRFVADSLARGAVAAIAPRGTRRRLSLERGAPIIEVDEIDRVLGEVAARFFARPGERMNLVGITGTNGKTTVAYILAQASTLLGTPCGYLGTLGVGMPGDLAGTKLTTPDAITLNRHLLALCQSGAQRLALEVSSHALSQDRISGLRINGAVFTNLSHDHLDYHGSMVAYARAKQRLFASADLVWAVVKANDPATSTMLEPLGSAVQIIACSVADRRSDAHVPVPAEVAEQLRRRGARSLQGRLESTSPTSTTLRITGDFGECSLTSPLVGVFNAENLLSALASLLAEGALLECACEALAQCAAPPGRLERVTARATNAPNAYVDYSHTPDSLEKALRALAPLSSGQLWCVFGCGGDRDREKRPRMGAIAARLADRLVVTDDNPRTESSAAIIAQIIAGIPAGRALTVEPDRFSAIRHALYNAKAEDLVLIAGKGHEDYQEVAGVRRPFSDAASARALLRERYP